MAKDKWPDWDVYKRDKCRCVYCGFDGKHNLSSFCHLEIDHLIPDKKAPFYDDHSNKVVACRSCNDLKGTYDPQERTAAIPDNRNRIMFIRKTRPIIMSNLIKRELLDDYHQMLAEIEGVA